MDLELFSLELHTYTVPKALPLQSVKDLDPILELVLFVEIFEKNQQIRPYNF